MSPQNTIPELDITRYQHVVRPFTVLAAMCSPSSAAVAASTHQKLNHQVGTISAQVNWHHHLQNLVVIQMSRLHSWHQLCAHKQQHWSHRLIVHPQNWFAATIVVFYGFVCRPFIFPVSFITRTLYQWVFHWYNRVIWRTTIKDNKDWKINLFCNEVYLGVWW